jgi:hypothetical protein
MLLIVAQFCQYIKDNQIFKVVNFMVRELSLKSVT